MSKAYDIIVIGGGHAGAEAAWAASLMGARTALVTMRIEAIGRMSCNPAIGGIGKGQIVCEIDALGGLMGLATDATGIQFRMLNRRKGPAVWAPRAQADRELYAAKVLELLQTCRNLELIEGLVEDILTTTHEPPAAARTAPPGVNFATLKVKGVELQDGRTLYAPMVIITTGTFLRGLMHCGEKKTEGGRVDEQSANRLSARLLDLGFSLRRLKTGTPPRVHRDTINFDVLQPQPGDDPPIPFSFMTDQIIRPQINCWITHTNPQGHEIIQYNLHRAPMYSGQIQATGVRYCPSIEDKVVRFADKPRHQIFLEPEGYDNERIYCNGMGTSLPQDVQEAFVHTLPGLENARIVQYGYAIEYDSVPTHQTQYSLESKLVSGLFLAGQINGTSGYEEAAGQGLIAGINAVRKLCAQEPLILRRDQAYIGVMIDDLIAKPPEEPYRMFTSRAEYRMLLRADNADQRLTPIGREMGLVDDQRWQRYQQKARQITKLEETLASIKHHGISLLDDLRRPDRSWHDLQDKIPHEIIERLPHPVCQQVAIRAKYSGYLERMNREIERQHQLENCKIPPALSFQDIEGLRYEAKERLTAVQPLTLGQAGRISGVTPADVTVLWIAIEARRRRAHPISQSAVEHQKATRTGSET